MNRIFANFADLNIEDISAEDAWKLLEAADKDRDVDDIKKVGIRICCSTELCVADSVPCVGASYVR